jgi:chromosomal replication initiation ATPase DnaA
MNEIEKQHLKELLSKYLSDMDAERYYNQIVMRSANVTPACGKIKCAVSAYFNLMDNEIEGQSKQQATVYARHIAMYLCYLLTNNSYPSLGRMFGGRDHTTVIYAVKKVIATPAMMAIANDIKASLMGDNRLEPINRARMKEIVAMDGVNYAA